MKNHTITVGRVFLLATLLAPLPAPVASQGDSAVVQGLEFDVENEI